MLTLQPQMETRTTRNRWYCLMCLCCFRCRIKKCSKTRITKKVKIIFICGTCSLACGQNGKNVMCHATHSFLMSFLPNVSIVNTYRYNRNRCGFMKRQNKSVLHPKNIIILIIKSNLDNCKNTESLS